MSEIYKENRENETSAIEDIKNWALKNNWEFEDTRGTDLDLKYGVDCIINGEWIDVKGISDGKCPVLTYMRSESNRVSFPMVLPHYMTNPKIKVYEVILNSSGHVLLEVNVERWTHSLTVSKQNDFVDRNGRRNLYAEVPSHCCRIIGTFGVNI